MAEKNLEEKIMSLMREGATRPLSLKELARALRIDKEAKRALKRAVNALVLDGSLTKIRGGRIGLPSKMNLVTGTISCHPDGFGFVTPEEGGEDVFIPGRKLKGAMHGDKVAARVEGVKPGGKREGSIVRIVSRANDTIVGIFKRHKGGVSVVIPSNERIGGELLIPPKEELNARDGEVVVAAVTRWPGRYEASLGRIIEILGPPDDPAVEVEITARKYGLPYHFPKQVLDEASKTPKEVLSTDKEGRTDLTGLTVVTIDGETAKDFDDAVSIKRTESGYTLYVSIADVAHYVKEGSWLDKEAFERGTSVYFPDRCVPMLPEALSNGICSLNPKVERLVMTAEMEFDNFGVLTNKKFYEGVIKSVERMTYTNVKKALEGDGEVLERYGYLRDDFRLMEELALKLNKLRSEEGSIDFDLPEPQIILDMEGRPQDIVKSERNIAHRIIEEFMLAANKAVAKTFTDKKLPFVYRIHETPDADSIEEFRDFVSTFGFEFKGTASPKAFQKILSSVIGKPEEQLVNHVLLRSMKQAVYSEFNVGHFGLAFEDYTHFTSPIRRYPDLIVHRLLKALIHKRYTPALKAKMEGALPHMTSFASARERNAMEAEREVVDLKKAQFMADKTGREFDGIISGVTSFGFFVELKDYFVEGLVRVTTLIDDYYTFKEKEHALVGESTKRRFRLGSEVRVRLTSVDMGRRRLDMELCGMENKAVTRGRASVSIGKRMGRKRRR